jgi:hypothetical protein
MLELYTSEPNTFFLKPLIALAKVAAAHGGFYASHIRHEEAGLLDAIQEAITIGLQLEREAVAAHDGTIICSSPSSCSVPLRACRPARPLGHASTPYRRLGTVLWRKLRRLFRCRPRRSIWAHPELDAVWVGYCGDRIAQCAGWREVMMEPTLPPTHRRSSPAAPMARVEKGLQWPWGPTFPVADVDAYPCCACYRFAPALVNRAATPRIAEYPTKSTQAAAALQHAVTAVAVCAWP